MVSNLPLSNLLALPFVIAIIFILTHPVFVIFIS
jgi:hypothetical protein